MMVFLRNSLGYLLFCSGVGMAQSCHQSAYQDYLKQAKKASYTENSYDLPTYKKACLPSFLTDKKHKSRFLNKLAKALGEKKEEWAANGTVALPHELFADYRKEILDPWLQKEEFKPLSGYYDAWTTFLKEPTPEHSDQLLKAEKENNACKRKLELALLEQLLNYPEACKLTPTRLAYQDCLHFFLDKKPVYLHWKLISTASYLRAWHQDCGYTGSALWSKFMENQGYLLKERSTFFSYRENKEAVSEALKVLEDFAQINQENDALNYRQLAQTIPHGLDTLTAILDELGSELHENDQFLLLRSYVKLVQSHLLH